jgi:glycosyltransferase involved in cell wall biosynthesis
MEERPFASVVVASRNRPELITRALRAVQAQSGAGWEAVVVDDGDGSSAAAASGLGDARIRALANPGTGLVDARNAGIAQARGAYACWLDDDDWWDDPGHLAALRAAAAQKEAVYHRAGWIVHPDGRREPFDWPATRETLRRDNTVLTSSIAYPRSWHRTVGLLDRSLGGYCDWDWLLRLVDAGLELRALEGLGVCYALHGANASREPATPERAARFELLREKHGLDAVVHSHATVHEALRGARP